MYMLVINRWQLRGLGEKTTDIKPLNCAIRKEAIDCFLHL